MGAKFLSIVSVNSKKKNKKNKKLDPDQSFTLPFPRTVRCAGPKCVRMNNAIKKQKQKTKHVALDNDSLTLDAISIAVHC